MRDRLSARCSVACATSTSRSLPSFIVRGHPATCRLVTCVEIAALSRQILSVKSERDRIHAQRGEISNSIIFLRDVLKFWKEFSQLTEHGTKRATLLQRLSALLKGYNENTSRLSQQLQGCVSDWEKVGEKLKKGNEHLLSIDFTCHYCHNAFHALPHLSYGKFSCLNCYTINS